jgi:hypothetical protein
LQIAETAPEGSNILCMLPDTGERYLSTPLFEHVGAEMNDEEIAISRSTRGFGFDAPQPAPARRPVPAPAAVDAQAAAFVEDVIGDAGAAGGHVRAGMVRVLLVGAQAVHQARRALPLGRPADETCQSPYMAKITGEEEFVYVWTLGMDGVGDESDKVVTIDVREGSETFGQVIDVDSVGGQHEAHHGGFTDDRRQFWVAGLDTSKIFIFDVATDPANPEARQDHRPTSSRRAAGWSARTAPMRCPGA